MQISGNTNVPALRAQRRLGQSTRDLSLVRERLASGRRVNRSADDAAGLSIASSLDFEARARTVALRNANDAVGALRIMGDAYSSQSQIVTRLSELAEQSANGTLSTVQREALDREYRALVAEYGRIGDSATYNGLDLLRGASGNAASGISFQVGTSGLERSLLTLLSEDSGSLSGTIDFGSLGFVSPLDSIETFEEFASRVNQIMWRIDTTDSSGNSRSVWIAPVRFNSSNNGIGFVAFLSAAGSTSPESATDGVGVNDFLKWNLSQRLPDSGTGALPENPALTSFVFADDFGGSVRVNLNFDAIRFRAEGSAIVPDLPDDPALEFTGVETAGRARAALDALAAKRERIAARLGDVGAIESRLEVIGNVNSVMREESSRAASQIVDAELAEDSARAAALAILQEGSVAVLAQARRQPEIILKLLEP